MSTEGPVCGSLVVELCGVVLAWVSDVVGAICAWGIGSCVCRWCNGGDIGELIIVEFGRCAYCLEQG